MVSENVNKDAINTLGVFNSEKDSNVFEVIRSINVNITGLAVNYEDTQREKILDLRDYLLTDIDLVLVQNLATDENVCIIGALSYCLFC